MLQTVLYIKNSMMKYTKTNILYIVFFLNTDFQLKASQSAFLEHFNDIIVDVPAEDMYYLLQTFASMALAREMNDLEFIRRVTTDLFKVGFINALTRDNCYKIVRDLLVNITSKHTELISDLLTLLKENFKLVSINEIEKSMKVII